MAPGLWEALSNEQWLVWLLFLRPHKSPSCCLPRQNVSLSQSHISLGNIPVQSKYSRLLFLNNTSEKNTIVFVWQLKPLDFGEVRVPRVHRIRTSSRAPDLLSLVPSCPIAPHPILSPAVPYCTPPPHSISSCPIPPL